MMQVTTFVAIVLLVSLVLTSENVQGESLLKQWNSIYQSMSLAQKLIIQTLRPGDLHIQWDLTKVPTKQSPMLATKAVKQPAKTEKMKLFKRDDNQNDGNPCNYGGYARPGVIEAYQCDNNTVTLNATTFLNQTDRYLCDNCTTYLPVNDTVQVIVNETCLAHCCNTAMIPGIVCDCPIDRQGDYCEDAVPYQCYLTLESPSSFPQCSSRSAKIDYDILNDPRCVKYSRGDPSTLQLGYRLFCNGTYNTTVDQMYNFTYFVRNGSTFALSADPQATLQIWIPSLKRFGDRSLTYQVDITRAMWQSESWIPLSLSLDQLRNQSEYAFGGRIYFEVSIPGWYDGMTNPNRDTRFVDFSDSDAPLMKVTSTSQNIWIIIGSVVGGIFVYE